MSVSPQQAPPSASRGLLTSLSTPMVPWYLWHLASPSRFSPAWTASPEPATPGTCTPCASSTFLRRPGPNPGLLRHPPHLPVRPHGQPVSAHPRTTPGVAPTRPCRCPTPGTFTRKGGDRISVPMNALGGDKITVP